MKEYMSIIKGSIKEIEAQAQKDIPVIKAAMAAKTVEARAKVASGILVASGWLAKVATKVAQ